MAGAVIGMDLGGSKLAAAVFSADGQVVEQVSSELAGSTGSAVGARIVRHAQSLAARIPALAAVGVAVPGIYRAATGCVWAPNIPGWDDYPLVDELRAALPPHVHVRVDSDRACAILGEAWRGNARGCRNAIFLVVGTGIGAGILAEGTILRGAGDAAGAIGWLGLDRPYRTAVYPAVGCFEYHASGPGIACVAHEYGMPGDVITARDVFHAADAGDPIARRVLDEAVGYWGMAIANLVSLFNPEKIILGGGVFGPATRLLDRIRAEARLWAQPISIEQVSIEPSALGSAAVLYGAGALALQATPLAQELDA